ncbi:MAG: helicase-related protein, partial [Cyclobacteriaceae bacterium]
INTLILDEFDKSLEIGFSEEMRQIIERLPGIQRKILTSATNKLLLPDYVQVTNPKEVNFLAGTSPNLRIRLVVAERRDKLKTLISLLRYIGGKTGIIFCNFKESISLVSNHLDAEGITHSCFYGGLEQKDRERALIRFRNGTSRLLLATDLAARGIDVPDVDFIIHYELPVKEAEFIHRNGRTARMHADGTAYVLQFAKEKLPAFISDPETISPGPESTELSSGLVTLFISGGRKDKISKGDIAGLFMKEGKLSGDELGLIELKQDCAFVAVAEKKATELIRKLNNSKLKKKKVRISIIS